MITKLQLKQALPNITDTNISKYYDLLEPQMKLYNINSTVRQTAFLAQVCVESANFSAVVENLNYNSKGLLTTFGHYFTTVGNPDPTKKIADLYARQPQKIANYVYANRLGNGNEDSGDGWKHRGRGLIQLTGEDMYSQYKIFSGLDVINFPELLEQPQNSLNSACWFWNNVKHLNEIADNNTLDSFKLITKKINGGYNGLPERIDNWIKLKQAFSIS